MHPRFFVGSVPHEVPPHKMGVHCTSREGFGLDDRGVHQLGLDLTDIGIVGKAGRYDLRDGG